MSDTTETTLESSEPAALAPNLSEQSGALAPNLSEQSGAPAPNLSEQSGVAVDQQQQSSVAPNLSEQSLEQVLGGNKDQVNQIVNKLVNNPQEMLEIAEEVSEHITPDLLERAKKLSTGSAGQNLSKTLQQKGMSRKELMSLQKQMKHSVNKSKMHYPGEKQQKVVHITKTRQLKEKTIYGNDAMKSVQSMLGSTSFSMNTSKRLAVGPLAGQQVHVYSSNVGAKNRLATRLLGSAVMGEAVIVCQNGNVTKADIEQLLLILPSTAVAEAETTTSTTAQETVQETVTAQETVGAQVVPIPSEPCPATGPYGPCGITGPS